MKETEYTYLSAFIEITKAISSTIDLEKVLHLMVKHTCLVTGSKGCALMLLDDKGQRLEVMSAYGLSRRYIDKGPVFVDRSMAETLKGTPVVIEDAASDPRVQYPGDARREGIASIVSIPIVHKEKVVGALRLYTSVPCRFTRDDIDFLMAVAAQSGLAIENARMYEDLKLHQREPADSPVNAPY